MTGVIIYASKTGTVENISNKLKELLNGEWELVNIYDDNSPDIKDYDKVILGTYMRRRKGDIELKEFIDKNKDALLKKQLFIFVSAGESGEVYRREVRDTFHKHILEKVDVYNIGAKIDRSSLGFAEKIIVDDLAKRQGKLVDQLNTYDEKRLENFARLVNTEPEYEEEIS